MPDDEPGAAGEAIAKAVIGFLLILSLGLIAGFLHNDLGNATQAAADQLYIEAGFKVLIAIGVAIGAYMVARAFD